MSDKNIYKGIVGLTGDQFETLRTTGSLEVDGITYTYSPKDTMYVTPQKSVDPNIFAKVGEENTFTAKNTFSEETIFEGTTEFNNDVKINNSTLKILDNTINSDETQRDIVTQYSADNIVKETNENTYTYTFPDKEGLFALITDTINSILQKSKFTSENGDDVWVTEEIDSSVYMKHENGTTSAGVRASKGYAELFSVDTDEEKTTSTTVSTSGGATTLSSKDNEGNSKELVVTTDKIAFSDVPKVKTNGEEYVNVALESALQNLVPAQSETTDGYYAQISNENGVVQITVSQNGEEPIHSIIVSKDGVLIDNQSIIANTQSDEAAVLYTEQELTSDQQTQVCSNLDLENKFVKAQVANSGELKVYCISGTNPHDVCLVTNVGKPNCVARYATSGQLKSVVDPVDDTDLVRLNYIKNKLNHQQVYFGTSLPSSGIGTTYLENDVFILSNNNGTKNFYQLNYIDNSSSLSWHDMVDFEKPKWQVFAPSDTSQVLMTEVTIITSDETNFTGMDGKKVTVNGYSADGFSAGTVVCDELDSDIPYSPAFIGSMTSTRASGVFVKSGSVAIVNVDNPEVTFSYKYLW